MKSRQDPRHEARKIALQVLFEWSYNSIDVEELLKRDLDILLETLNNLDKKNTADGVSKPPKLDLSLFLVKGVTDNLEALDKIIQECAPEWPIEQIAKVDLEILRLAIFELYIARNVPPKVSIDEAVELAKEFGGENSSKFINGVLGTVVKTLMPEVLEEEEKKRRKK